MSKILIADKLEAEAVEALAAAGHTVYLEPALQDESLTDALVQHRPDVLVVRSTKVRADAIGSHRELGLIVRAGAGVDNIDLDAASKAGVAVANCPGMNSAAVAELTMGLLLACDRRIPDQVADLRRGIWDKQGYGKCRGLKGRTLGLVGLGAIGKLVIDRALAFEMRVVAWSRSLDRSWCLAKGVEYGGQGRSDLLAMVGACDAVSVHVALTDETKGLCDTPFFEAMKPGAIFINTSRGGIADEAALRQVITAKGLRCGLDVHAGQPQASTGTFEPVTMALEGAYGTHHCGASTDQAQAAVGEETVRIIRAFAERGELVNCVNASLISRPAGRPGS